MTDTNATADRTQHDDMADTNATNATNATALAVGAEGGAVMGPTGGRS